MAVQIIANVIAANGAIYKAPVTASWSSNIAGTGNITISSGATSVTGDVGVLGNNYVIRTTTNTYVGTVKSKIGTTVTLFSPAATGITSSVNPTNFKYQSYSQTLITNELSPIGNGTISVYTINSAVIGSGTTFKTQLDLGYQIFDNSDSVTPNLLGVIRSITSDTRADFTTNCAANSSSIQYQFYNTTTKNSSNIFSEHTHVLNKSMLEWSRSGLIQNLSQVKSYHPPVADPVTGIPVNFPASIHITEKFANIANVNISHLDSTIDSNYSKVNANSVIKAFNAEHGIIGSSLNKAINSIPFNAQLKKLTFDPTITDEQFRIELRNIAKNKFGNPIKYNIQGLVLDYVPTGFVKVNRYETITSPFTAYQGPSANVVYVLNETVFDSMFNTVSDSFALLANQPPSSRIINSLADARNYFKNAENEEKLSDSKRADLAARAPEALQFTPDTDKRLVITGAPASIPGQLNVILQDEDPANRKYVVPKYYKPINTYGSGSYNKDLPPSLLNLPPPEY